MKSTKKLAVYIVSVLSLAFVLSAVSFSQTAQASQSAPEKLTQQQLNTMIANAKTPADHQRIARYYEAQAQQYIADAIKNSAKVVAYNKSPYTNICLMCVSSNYSLQMAARAQGLSEQIAEERAMKLQELAKQQQAMADVAAMSSRVGQ